MKGDSEAPTVATLNDYTFPVRETDVERPNNLYTESQLREAVDEITPDSVDVEVNSRFTKTVARTKVRRATGDVEKVEVSWRVFDDEENRYAAGNGWDVLVSCLRDLGALE